MDPVKQITEMLRDNQSQVREATPQVKTTLENLTADQSPFSQEKVMSQEQNSKQLIETPAGNTEKSPEGDIDFDLDAIRLPQDFGASSGVKKLLTTVPVRKPNKSLFIRTHAEFRMDVSLLKYGTENDLYLVMPGMIAELEELPKPHRLVLAIDRTNTPFIWPLAHPDPEHPLHWHSSAMEADVEARARWIRIEANKNLGAYVMFVAQGQLSEPIWPDVPWNQLVSIAFKQKIIDSPDHVVAQRLRGEL